MSHTLLVSVALARGDELLLVREGKPHMRGKWNLPGGRVEPDEAVVEAAAREAREETGLDVRIAHLIRVYNGRSPAGAAYVLFSFRGEVEGGTIAVDGGEILDARWWSPAAIAALPDTALWNPALFRRRVADLRAGLRADPDVIFDGPFG